MRFVIDSITALLFWSLTFYSAHGVYDFFRDGAIQKIERGLSSTEKLSEALIQDQN